MSTRPVDVPRSRLDPEPVPRRDFLGLTALWTAMAALGFAALGSLRLPRAAVVPVPSRKFRVTLPETLAPGTPFLPSGRPVAVFRSPEGVYAVSTVCTHLGCIVKQASDGFHCPCHGSRFARDGEVIKGPAPSALPWLSIAQVADDTFVIDEGKTVPQGTRVAV